MPDDILRHFNIDPTALEPQSDYSWAFEPWLATGNASILVATDKLATPAMQLWTNSRVRLSLRVQQDVMSCLKVILWNLIRAASSDPMRSIGIATGKEALNSSRRYRPAFMSERAFTAAMNALIDANVIHRARTAYHYAGGGQITRYRLTAMAMETMQSDLTRRHVERTVNLAHQFWVSDANETIRLKDRGINRGSGKRQPRLCHYDDTDETHRMRDNLARINVVLSKAQIVTAHPISLDAYYDPDRLDDYRLIEEAQTLYRVFNHTSFDLGGRFYGGWWQYVRKGVRRGILINGHRTVEADYSGLHPAILFAERGIDIPPDPYSAVRDLSSGENPVWRKAVKRTFNAMLNATQGTIEPRNFDLTPYGIDRRQFQKMVRDAFPDLQDAFGTGTGRRLQRADSDLMEAILLRFADQGVPVLPVHDSVIIQADRQDELLHVMKNVFRERYGQTPPVRLG